MSGSTLRPFRAALRTLWVATFDPAVVQVTYGPRVTASLGQRIMIGDAEGTCEPEALGPRRNMAEEYDVRCIASVSMPATPEDQQTVTDTCLALFDAAELAVRSAPTMTLAVPGVLRANIEGAWSLVERTASETSGSIGASFEFRVHVEARYSL